MSALVAAACSPSGADRAPIPPGDQVTVASWDVRVLATRTDPDRPVPANATAFDVKVSAWFSGNGAAMFGDDVTIRLRDDLGTLYPPRLADCPGALDIGRELTPDQSIEGYVCFAVDRTDELELLLDPADADPVVLAVPAPAPSEEFGPSDLVAGLTGLGLDVRLVESPYAEHFATPRASSRQVLCVDGQEAQVFTYPSGELRRADSSRILPTGNPENGYIDLYYGRLGWWAKGRIIVFYALADPDIEQALTAVMGDTISPDARIVGTVPEPGRGSEVCSGG